MKIKKILFTLLVMFVGICSVNAVSIIKGSDVSTYQDILSLVNSFDPDFDKNVISFPPEHVAGDGNITLKNISNNYKMQYKWVKLSDTVKIAIESSYNLVLSDYEYYDDATVALSEAIKKCQNTENCDTDTDESVLDAKDNWDTAKYSLQNNITNHFNMVNGTMNTTGTSWVDAYLNAYEGDFSDDEVGQEYILWIKVYDKDNDTTYIDREIFVKEATIDEEEKAPNDTTDANKPDESTKDENQKDETQKDENQKDETVESPKTGIATYTLAIIGGLAVAGGVYYFLKKKNIIKKI